MRPILATVALSSLLALPALSGAALPAAGTVLQTSDAATSQPARPVPEPQPLLYVGVGLLVIALVCRRRRPRVSTDPSSPAGTPAGPKAHAPAS